MFAFNTILFRDNGEVEKYFNEYILSQYSDFEEFCKEELSEWEREFLTEKEKVELYRQVCYEGWFIDNIDEVDFWYDK